MLRTMIPLYLRGMIFDTFSLGDIQVKHNVRDCWFENELSRFKIVIKKRLINGVIPYHKKHCRFKHSNYFNWSETLVIDKNGKKLC